MSFAPRRPWIVLGPLALVLAPALSCATDRTASVGDDGADASVAADPARRELLGQHPSAGGIGAPADLSRSVVQHAARVESATAASSLPFRDLPAVNDADEEEEVDHEPLRPPPKGGTLLPPTGADSPDLSVQSGTPIVNMPLVSKSFRGQGSTGAATCPTGGCETPPDTNGAVGPNHFVQTTNLSGTQGLAIWDKQGTLLAGPKHVNTLWSTLPATDPCNSRNDGDPVVVYDQLADRWFITQFALPHTGTAAGPSFQCVAVSKTPDPTGAYWLYEFSYAHGTNDYGKFGIWPDAYYATINEFGTSFAGADFCAYDRNSMLTGATATQHCFLQAAPTGAATCTKPPYPTEPFQVFGALPVSLDGPIPPPDGEPGHFVQFDYSQCGPTYNELDLWTMHVDFATPANSTLTGPSVLTVSPFTPTCFANGLTGGSGLANCLPQPGSTVTLDGLDDRVMFRFAYRNFGQYESLLVNHSVAGGTGKGGTTGTGSAIRWYELQMQPGGTSPTVVQQSTYAPADGNWRWMGSIAQDQAGGMALGFAVTSNGVAGAVTFPSIAWTGRINSDPASTMGQGETIIDPGTNVEGDAYPASGSQKDELRGRWGDYSNMTIDPTDDCTFWYTQEIYDTTAKAPIGSWDTYVAASKFPNCGANDFSIALTPATNDVTPGKTATFTVSTTKTAGTAETLALFVQSLPPGVTLGSFNPPTVTAGGSSVLTLTAAATAPVTAAPPSFMVIAKATSAVHPATAQIAVTTVPCGAAGQACCPGNTCTAPSTCTAGMCACTSNGTCTGGASCGTGVDNCGKTISCGACTAPQTCGGGGTPGACGMPVGGSDAGATDGGGLGDAGKTPQDSGTSREGGLPGDAAVDAGSSPGSSGGCGCVTAGGGDGSSSRLALAGLGGLAMLGLVRVRRRRSAKR